MPEVRTLRRPPLRALPPLVAKACAGLARGVDMPWEEISVQLAAQTVQLACGVTSNRSGTPPCAMERVTRIVRTIDRHPDARLTLGSLAREAGFRPFHFLRMF